MWWLLGFILFICWLAWLGNRHNNKPIEYRVRKFWRDDLAKSWYTLEYRRGEDDYWHDTGWRGNIKWAKRTKEHYKCNITNEAL